MVEVKEENGEDNNHGKGVKFLKTVKKKRKDGVEPPN